MIADLAIPMSRRIAQSSRILTALAALVAAGSGGQAWAQAQPETIPPPSDFARLDPLVGSWEGSVTYPSQPHGRATPNKANPKVTATVAWMLNRYHLKIELCHHRSARCPDAVMIISYDLWKKKYLLYAIYDSGLQPSVYEGKFNKAKALVFNRTWRNGEMRSRDRLVLTVESPSGWRMLTESDTVPGDYETDLAPVADYKLDSKSKP
jgi:hypothetical protein